MIRGRAAAVLLLVGLVGAGCGEGDDSVSQFRDDYNDAIGPLNAVNSSIQEAGEEAGRMSGPQISREFDRIADSAERTRFELSNLEPHEGAQDELDALVAAIDDGIDDLRAVARAAKQENQQRFLDATVALSESGEEISEAETELKDAVESD
jgi:acyl-CoA reductase-like NAD-dependent aldehyde dehydrogenase